MSNRTLLSTFVLLVAVVCFSTWTKAQNDVAGPNDDLRQLLIERRDTLEERLNAIEASFNTGKAETNVVIQAELDLRDAKLALSTQHDEQITILEEVVANMRRIEDSARQRLENGIARQEEVYLAKAERLQAEINLVKARAVGN